MNSKVEGTPLISVIIPTYNRSGLLLEAIGSVCNQRYTHWELIVVDDGSTDDTKEKMESFQRENIHYISYHPNKGACTARNLGVKNARGEYIAFLDSDDQWLPHTLETQLNLLAKEEVDMVFSAISLWDLKKEESLVFPTDEEEGVKDYQRLLRRSIGSTQTFFAKKEVFLSCPFDEKMPRMQDWDVLLQISQKYQVYFHSKPLAVVYQQPDSLTNQSDKGIAAYENIYEKHQQAIENDRETKALHVLLKGLLLYQKGEDPTEFYQKNLHIKAPWKFKIRIWGKYYLGKSNLLNKFYKNKK